MKIAQTGKPELPAAVHDIMIGERKIESGRLPCIRPNRFNPHAEHIPLGREEFRARFGESGCVRSVLSLVYVFVRIGPG